MKDGAFARFAAITRGPRLPVLALGLILALTASPALAHHHHGRGRVSWGSPTDPTKDAALVVDGETGKVLYARNADAERHPASLTKMMTLYLLFDAIKKGQVNLATPLPVSGHAAAQKPTKLHLQPGDTISVENAIKAIVVRSANDVAVTIAEALGGTESHFAELMTAKARQIGMRDTFYHNASGLPDALQISTASDLAVLARHLAYDFPQYFHYFSTPAFTYRGVTYPTHDNLIGRYQGADGIKTGYTGASGFNLVSSVVRGKAHIIGVVMGGRTAHRRDREMISLLDQTFDRIGQNPMLVASAKVPWQVVAENTPPAVAGFDLSPPSPRPAAAPTFVPAETEDEDAAESRPDEEDAGVANVAAAPPAPVPATTVAVAPAPPPPAQVHTTPMVATHAVPAPAFRAPQPKPRPMIVASLQPKSPKPAAQPETGEGDFGDDPTPAKFRAQDWTIQIGAYADKNIARAQLATYAERSMDVLGQAARIVIPFRAVDGQTLFRARFGPFVEREAREVCTVLTQRGQTCFAAMATR